MTESIQGVKYAWRLPQRDVHKIYEIAAAFNISIPVAHTLYTRGLTEHSAITSYLFSSYEQDVSHPGLLKDADKAVDRIIAAINNKEKILIFGDYDVDGITSSSLMMLCMLPLGAQINFFLPNRVRDGYGLNSRIVERAAKNGYSLIITVDNGITAFEPAEVAARLGVDLIITDHHRPHDHVPIAHAIVNPHQKECGYPFKYFAGVGVIFKLMCLLYERLGKQIPEKAYELLLLGTVADVVPLTGENRYWVRHGLQQVNQQHSLSLQVLKHNAQFTKSRITATDIGFSITPQINALGRLEDPRDGVKFLLGTDQQEVQMVGTVLHELNQARRDIEKSIIDDINSRIQKGIIDLSRENIIMAASDQWPAGVIGLVASRFVGMYGKPTLLFHLTKDGVAKGSCRSIPEFSMFDALHDASHLLNQFGGHSVAAGLSLPAQNLPVLKEFLEERIVAKLTPEERMHKIYVDAYAQLSDINTKLMHDFEYLEPFGHENRQPLLCIQDVVQVQPPQLLKDAHVKCSFFGDGVIKPVIFFNRPELYPQLQHLGTQPVSLAAHAHENHWNGRTNVELTGVDIAGISS